MNIVSTAVSGALRGISLSSWLHAPILGASFVTKRTCASNKGSIQEEEDVLYKRCELECRSVDPAVLQSYSFFTQMAARELGITVGECTTPRKPHKKRWSMLKSVFIYAKHQVQYEVRTYYHTMNFLHVTGSTADTFLEYVQRNLPEGVALKVTRVRLERLPEHLKTSPSMLSTNIEEEMEEDEGTEEEGSIEEVEIEEGMEDENEEEKESLAEKKGQPNEKNL